MAHGVLSVLCQERLNMIITRTDRNRSNELFNSIAKCIAATKTPLPKDWLVHTIETSGLSNTKFFRRTYFRTVIDNQLLEQDLCDLRDQGLIYFSKNNGPQDSSGFVEQTDIAIDWLIGVEKSGRQKLYQKHQRTIRSWIWSFVVVMFTILATAFFKAFFPLILSNGHDTGHPKEKP